MTRYKYDKSQINKLSININPKTGKSYSVREIVKELNYGNGASMTGWLNRNGNRLVHVWLNQDEIDLILKLLGS